MTLNKASFIDNGPLIGMDLFRTAAYMSGGRYEGVATADALKVRATPVASRGVIVGEGAAFVLNRYLSAPDQAYPVTNIGEETLGSSFFPGVDPVDRSHLVVVTVGDPNYSQVSHPWMPGVVPVGEVDTFQYVRFYVIPNVPAGTKRFESLGSFYPAYALARIDIPGGATNITDAMITDLREIPFPRSVEFIRHMSGPTTAQDLNGQGGTPGEFQNFPNTVIFPVDIPVWATRAYITGFAEGLRCVKAGTGKMRVQFGAIGTTESTNIDEPAPGGGDNGIRVSYNLGGEIAIPAAYRGQTVNIRIEATPNTTASKGFLKALDSSSGQIRVRLAEKAS